MAFRFIHMADVHLDTPFKSRDFSLQRFLRESIRQAFKLAIDLALEKDVHGVLVAGDLFDCDTLSFATEKFLLQQVERLKDAGIGFFYSPGNHDSWNSMYRLHRTSWPSNVHIFNSHEPERYVVRDREGKEVGIIIGAGYEEKKEMRNLSKDFPQKNNITPTVGLIHTNLTSAEGASSHERYAPCSQEDLIKKGYDYWALGHVHRRQEIIDGASAIVYPGNILGRNPGEDGQKGVYYVEISPDGGVKTQFYPVAPLCWLTLNVENLSDAGDLHSLENAIEGEVEKQLKERGSSLKLLLRIQLRGPCPLCGELLKEENIENLTENLKASLKVEYLELVPEGLVRPVNPDHFRNEAHVLGTALEIFHRAMEDDELLLRLAPEPLAGLKPGASRDEKVLYLKGLMEGLDYEAAALMTRGDEK